MFYKVMFLSLSLLIIFTVQSCYAASSCAVSNVCIQSKNKQIEVSDIKKAWSEGSKNITRQTKNYPRQQLNLMLEILEASPRGQIKVEYEKAILNPGDFNNLPEYEQIFLQGLVSILVRENNSNELIDLISKKAPRLIASTPLELYLTLKHPDKLLILFKSYEIVQNEDAKKMLLEVFDCVFKENLREVKDDDSVKTAQRWYTENSKLSVNPYYSPYSLWPSQRKFFTKKKI